MWKEWIQKALFGGLRQDGDVLFLLPGTWVSLPPRRGEVLDGEPVTFKWQVGWMEREFVMLASRVNDRHITPAIRKRIPSWIVEQSMIRAGIECIYGNEIVPEVTYMDIYKRIYNKRRNIHRHEAEEDSS